MFTAVIYLKCMYLRRVDEIPLNDLAAQPEDNPGVQPKLKDNTRKKDV